MTIVLAGEQVARIVVDGEDLEEEGGEEGSIVTEEGTKTET